MVRSWSLSLGLLAGWNGPLAAAGFLQETPTPLTIPLNPSIAPGQEEFDRHAREEVADIISALAILYARDPIAAPVQLESSGMLVRLALTLKPNDIGLWSIASLVAATQDPANRATDEWVAEIITALARLDPTSDVYRLARLTMWIESASTAEERITRTRGLLVPAVVDQIGKPVAAHLAWDLSLLLRQRGDAKGADAALGDALNLDPSFAPASAAAAGMALERLANPVEQAEWMVAAIDSNPGDRAILKHLAALLLREGAYTSATRVLSMLVALDRRSPSVGDDMQVIVADTAVAMAGTGNLSGAREVMRVFQRRLDNIYQDYLVHERGESHDRVRSAKAPTAELLGTMDGLLARAGGFPDATLAQDAAIAGLIAALKGIDANESFTDALRHIAHLETAQALAGLGAPRATIEKVLTPIIGLVSDESTAFFAGYYAMSDERWDEALTSFEKAGAAPATNIARAMVLQKLSRRPEAGRALHAASEVGRGTLLGAIALHQLRELAQQPLPQSKTANDLDAVMAQMSPWVEKITVQGEAPIDLVLTPVSAVFAPFQLPDLTLKITNRTPIELAFSDDGPLERFVAVTWLGVPFGSTRVTSDAPLVVPVSSALVLPPYGSIIVQVDGRLTVPLLFATNAAALNGMTLRLRAVMNPALAPPTRRADGTFSRLSLPPGPTGAEGESHALQCGAFAVTPAWIEECLTAIRYPDAPNDLARTAMLGAYIGSLDPGLTAKVAPSIADSAVARVLTEAFATAWARMTPMGRAYLMLVSSGRSPMLEEVYARSTQDPSPIVRTAYVLRRIDDPQDPFLQESVESEDPLLRSVAQGQLSLLIRVAIQKGATTTDEDSPR
ncbi:MAG: hypothetical protein O2800_03430 [Planctomycetota bacterium]|nr:hypothetical protein [Planctomycetota bacterium]